MSLKEYEVIKTKKSNTKDSYELFDEPVIKAPLSILRYNLNFEFLDDYPAKMPQDFARDMIKLYSKPNDTVWDGFGGSGIVPREAAKLGRHGIYSDINQAAYNLALEHAEKNTIYKEIQYYLEDIRKIKFDTQIDLIVSSPPFGLNIAGDKNNYSDHEDDLSNSGTYEKFFENIKPCFESYFNNLKPNGVCILDARDRSKDGHYFDLINYFRNICLDIGFELISRYYYEMIPWMQFTAKDKDTKFVKPMPDAMDVLVLKKPAQEKLFS